jgi:hypothetical protein
LRNPSLRSPRWAGAGSPFRAGCFVAPGYRCLRCSFVFSLLFLSLFNVLLFSDSPRTPTHTSMLKGNATEVAPPPGISPGRRRPLIEVPLWSHRPCKTGPSRIRTWVHLQRGVVPSDIPLGHAARTGYGLDLGPVQFSPSTTALSGPPGPKCSMETRYHRSGLDHVS